MKSSVILDGTAVNICSAVAMIDDRHREPDPRDATIARLTEALFTVQRADAVLARLERAPHSPRVVASLLADARQLIGFALAALDAQE